METQIQNPESETKDLGLNVPTLSSELTGRDTQRRISEIKYIALDALKAHPRNAEIYGDQPSPELIKSIEESGVRQPIVLADDQKTILGGHLREAAARIAGLKEVPVIVSVACSDEEMLKALLGNNIQRVKSNLQVAREIAARHALEMPKALERKASAKPGKRGGQIDPEKLPGAFGDTREIVAKEHHVGEKTVPAAVAIVARLDELKEAGKSVEAEELIKKLNTTSIQRAARTLLRDNPGKKGHGKKASPNEVAKKQVIARIVATFGNGLRGWSVERLTKLEQEVADLRKGWEVRNPVVKLKAGDLAQS